MAELYENPKQYLTAGGSAGSTPTGEPSFEDMLASLPPEEREEAMQFITAPPSGEEIMKAMQQKNSQGEVMNMSLEQYRLYKAHNKTKEVDVISGIGEAASTVFEEISKAAGSVVDNPADALQKLTPSVIEAFAQGTRSMYGMAAQSADPNSVFFRMKNALQANGDDEEAEYQQFMEAQAFNVHSMRLMTGQDTIIMDKDVINPEMTQVMSYIADPTLFIPFGGIAAKGASMVGMGEKLAMAAARTQGIRNLVLGGAIKWGVGAPLEFMGGAIRNTIDYGIDTGSRVFETATGVAAKDIASAARVGSLGTAAGSVAGLEVNSTLATASRYYAGSLVARNVGEAASIYGEQMMKQGKTGRGILGYAGQAIRDTERQGIKLTPQTKSLLKAIEAVDPLFVYADDIASGAAQGAMIGGGLGYLAGGEEGFAGGVGSGMALGAVGATAGKVVSDVTGNTKIDQMAIQRKLIIEALKENGNENAVGFEAMAAMAEATGDRAFQGYIDGIIAGIDTVNPDAVFKAFNKVQYETHLKTKGIDPNTGVLLEKSRIFPELNDRTVKADVLGILRDTGGNFAGDPAGFEQAVKSNPAFAKVKPIWNRLDDNAKQVILKQIKDNGDPAFTKSLKGRQLNAHWSDMAYAEKATEIVNTLNQKNANSVPAKVAELLKAETRPDKKLTRRGQMLKEKLQADGYIDKDGNVRTSRLKDVEGTQGEFEASAGWAKSRDSSGRTEVVINLDKWAMDSGNRLSLAHELYHSIMLDSVFAPDYIDRLSQKLLGKFDPKTGRILEQALVQPDELMKFFGKYIDNDPSNRGDAETIKRKKEELKKSIEDYRTRGTANRVADATAIPLEHLVEEFGAYYFSKWVKAQPIDYMFRGGEFGGIRGLMEMVSDGWLDYWKGKVNEKNPQFNFDGMGVSSVSKAFEKDGKRVSSRSLDLFMRDIVRIEANRNSNNGFDVNKLSKESREWFLKVNGLRGAAFGQLDQQGNVKKPKLRRYTAEEIRQGKEMFKVMESLPDAAHKDGMRRDGDGNWSGQPNTAQINALVGAGFIQRAWFDRMNRAFDIVNGNGSNVVEFGYLGYSVHIGDGNERVYGAAVPFKNRRAVLIGVDFKVRADGTVYSNLHTLDLKVIEARGNEVWKDPQTRELWKGSRTDMEADFYAYLSNASLPSDHPNRKPSAKILDKGDGLGGQRRDALHQMLGFHKGSDMPYINRPIAEIPVGIRHSVTTFSNDGIVNMRVDNKPRYNFNFENAHLDLSRNFMPDEMKQETTPSGGKIIKHATGYQISKQAGEKFKVFDPEGKSLGAFDTVADAGRAAQKHFNETFDKSVEGKDPAVPPTEIPPSRVGYKDKRVQKILDDNKIEQSVIEALEKQINDINSKENQAESASNYYSRPFKDALEVVKKEGLIKALRNENVSSILEQVKIKPDVSSLGDIDIGIPHYAKDLKVSYLLDKLTNLSHHEYDSMYPMEIKSALHPRLAQIFQDYPNLTAQGLLKKLVVYGSQGSRMFQEATEIGLVDLLKSKIQKTTTPRFLPDGRMIEMTQGLSQPKLDMAEILDFAKSKEIKVTIEEGAREASGMDTSKYTLGGAKDNYKQTAIRINPEYAHGIKGHYGEDTIVHFRTTERLDADGNRHLYIEEVQANNTDKSAKKSVDVPLLKKSLTTLKNIRQKGIEEGVLVIKGSGNVETALGDLLDGDIGNNPYLYKKFKYGIQNSIAGVLGEIPEMLSSDSRKQANRIRNTIEDTLLEYHDKGVKVTEDELFITLEDNLSHEDYDMIGGIRANRPNSVFDFIDKGIELNNGYVDFLDEYSKNKERVASASGVYENISNIIPRLDEMITDLNTGIKQAEASSNPLPLTSAKDWTLTALKGIIRQAIRDGLDRITLTHPDDSPTTSHMAGDARRPLYGKLIPEIWGSWLRKYGIEIAQSNKLTDTNVAKAKDNVAQVSSKISEANKKVLERFEKVGAGENPEVINALAKILATPVHEYDGDLMKYSSLAGKVSDVELSEGIRDILLLKQTELHNYKEVLRLQEESIPKQHGISASQSSSNDSVNAGISAEAIDRGMTFILNDRLKRDFLDGKIQTHMMPAEDNYSGGRIYDQNSKQFKSGFLGLYAAENPDRVKGVSLQFMKRADGSHRIRLTDNSKKGESADIGHITANIQGDTATLSSHINEDYRGKKLAYVVYSEMAERLRAMGVTAVDGTIVNPDGVPIKVREKIIGDTRDLYSGRKINYVEGANRIRDKQEIVGSMGGVDVTNTLYKQARYMPSESFTPSEEVTRKAKEAGYTILGQHKTDNQFNEFDLKAKKANRGINPAGHYFTTTDNDYKGSRTINAFLKLENPWNGVATKADKQAFKQWFKDKFASQYEGASDTHIAYLDGKMNQFVRDGIFPTLMNGDAKTEFLKSRGYDGWKDGSDVVVFDSSQIKSAEDFTYDNQGNKIPLSERFDKSKKDIRYMPTEGRIESIHEDNFNIDSSKAETEALKIAKDSGINILRGKTLSQVYVNDSDVVLGGLWTEVDGNKFSFDVVVDKDSRKKGIGSMLIKSALNEFNSLNEGGSLVLDVDVTSNEMKRLLEKNGFVVKGKENGHTFMTKAHYMMAEDNRIVNNSSNVKLLFEGLESGRIIRTSSYKGLGLEDAELIAHTPDTAKVGTITAGDKALGEMQGGVFYAIANGNLIWASNFAGEGNTNVLLKYAQDALAKNPDKRTYIMLVKPENSKNFSAKEGARVVTSIFSHLNDTGVITNDKIVKALKNAAENNLGMKFEESATKQDIVRQIDERILTATPEEVSFGKRGAYALDIVRELNASKAFKNKKRIKKLEASFHNASFPRGLTIDAFKEVFGNLLAEDFIKDVPVGHVYGALEITKPLKETVDSRHRGYDRGIMHEDESPAKLILFDKTAHVTEIVNKGNPARSDYNKPIKIWDKEGDGSQYHSWTGGNIPYQQVKGKNTMPFQPAEGWRDWQSERTSVGSVVKNAVGYVIMVQGDKFKVYNPYKALVGIYSDLEQAKRRVQRDEPKR
jgi:GNAT superfamily N-acetyltransferase